MTSTLKVIEGAELRVNGVAGADYDLSAEGLANGAGRVSSQIDFGAERASRYGLSCSIQCQATPTQYGTFSIYLAGCKSSGASIAGDVGTADAALGDVDQVRNLRLIGQIIVEDANTTKMSISGVFEVYQRYGSIVVLNNTGAALNATDSNFELFINELFDQGQDT